MWRIALKSLLSHKRRLIGTASAVVLGVAFLAGTLVLTDTMRAAFDDIFTRRMRAPMLSCKAQRPSVAVGEPR